jgi:SAM-dependent methyltransferase
MTLLKDTDRNEIKYLRKSIDLTGKRILEVGSGEGRLTWQYAGEPHSVVAFDTDLDAMRIARVDRPDDLKDKVQLACMDAALLPFADAQFDVVLFSWSLCCIEPEHKMNALEEARRVLAPGGALIDMRALLDEWPIEVVSLRETRKTTRVRDIPEGLEHDAGADRAIAQAGQYGWFQRESEEFFSLVYAWDTPKEMEADLDEDWSDFILLEDDGRYATRSAWAQADADARVRLKVKVLVARWKRMD